MLLGVSRRSLFRVSAIAFFACILALLSARSVGATGIGPAVNVTGPGAVATGDNFDLMFEGQPAGTDPYDAVQIEVTYDSSLVTVTGVDVSPMSAIMPSPGPLCVNALADTMGGTLSPPMKAFVVACAAVPSGVTATGLYVIVHAYAVAAGQVTFHMVTSGAPDNGGPRFGTYTGNAADFTVQSNELRCAGHCAGADALVDITGVASDSISGTVSRATPAISAVSSGTVTACLHASSLGCQTVATDAFGAYSFTTLLPRSYDLIAHDPAVPSDVFGEIGPILAGSPPVTGQSITIQEPTGGISGHVLDQTAAPIANVSVSACPSAVAPCRTTTTAGDGSYTIDVLASDPAYTVTARAPEPYPDNSAVVSVGNVEVANVDITLTVPTGGVSGHVLDPSNAPLAGVLVYFCGAPLPACTHTLTDGNGAYSILLPPAVYQIVAYPNAIYLPNFISVPVSTVVVTGQDITAQTAPAPAGPIPAGTTLSPSSLSGGGTFVYWHYPLTLSTVACPGASSATYSLVQGANTLASGSMSESPAGTYSASIPPMFPQHSGAQVHITVVCPGGGGTTHVDFDIYIDPSGVVQDTHGNRIAGATVTLKRADTPAGPFTAVPGGSLVMSPSNRTNPDQTDAHGGFGWDVIPGYYIVEASKPGCASADDPTNPSAHTNILTIPPPVTGIALTLDCSDVDGDGYLDMRELGVQGDPFTYCAIMRADVDGNGRVNILDLSQGGAHYHQSVPPAPERIDQGPLPRDGVINILDLSRMAAVYNQSVSACP